MGNKASINVQPVKLTSEKHNKREMELDYVRQELSHLNEQWESDSISNRRGQIEMKYQTSVGQKMQKKATPIREAVLNITEKKRGQMKELKKLAQAFEKEFGIKTFQIHTHYDEGHWDHKTKEWKPNYHAHMVFDWTNDKGKSIKLNKYDMVKMQDMTAKILGMERGQSSCPFADASTSI